jgi:hypothetical protein
MTAVDRQVMCEAVFGKGDDAMFVENGEIKTWLTRVTCGTRVGYGSD